MTRLFLWALAAVACGAGYAYACSCVSQYHPYTEPETTEVFLAQINILKLWKGSPTVKEISTGFGVGDCGLPFKAGQKVLVYGDQTDIADRVSTGSCSRTDLLDHAGKDVAVLDGFAANPLKARVFKEPVEVYSKYDRAFTLESVDKELHTTMFKGKLAMTGTLWIKFDSAANGMASGDVLHSLFVPDEAFRAKLPQVVEGFYPGALDSMSVGPADDLLVAVYGKEEAGKVSRGRELEVSMRVRIEIDIFSSGIECDSRVYWANVAAIKVIPPATSAALAPRPASTCGG